MIKIHETLKNVDLFDLRNDDYFRKENAKIRCYRDQIYITDLTNALKPGKNCVQYIISSKYHTDHISCDFENWMKNKELDIIKIIKQLRTGNFSFNNNDPFGLNIVTKKSIRTFSPFIKVKPIKQPQKWTITHVWKAMLSGQINKGSIRQRLTDDYAYDAAVNFMEGVQVDCLEMAKELVENPSGWWVSPRKETDKHIELSVCCHYFDLRTFYFDKTKALQAGAV